MRSVIFLTIALAALGVGPAAARTIATDSVVALAPGTTFGAGPVFGSDLIWASTQGHNLVVDRAGLGDGEVTRFPGASFDVPVGSWNLAAGDDNRVALQALPERGGKRVFLVGDLAEGLRELPTGTEYTGQMFVTPAGVLTVEGEHHRPFLTDDSGARREVALPAGAHPETLTVNETMAAVAVRQGVEVFDLQTGDDIRHVPGGEEPYPHRISVGLDGSVAFVDQGGLWWSVPGSKTPTQLDYAASGDALSVNGQRIAYSRYVADTNDDAMRPVVIDVSGKPAIVFRGPPAAYVRTLDLSADHVAWSTDHCQLVGAIAAGTVRTIPAGPCIRSDFQWTVYGSDRPTAAHPYARFGLTCATASDGLCDIEIRPALGLHTGRGRFYIRAGHHRVVRIRFTHRGVQAAAKQPLIVYYYFLRDPDGKTAADYIP